MIICKHCGESAGFYTRQQAHGLVVVNYTNTGDMRDENGTMHDDLFYTGGKNAYCRACDRYLGKTEDLVTGETEETDDY